jgi:Prealbumin-like fold domain
VTVNVGEIVTCTFGNAKLGSIKVVKNAVGAQGTFAFTSNISGNSVFSLATTNGVAEKMFSNLNSRPATTPFVITETAQSGWLLSGQNCVGDNATPANLADDRTTAPNAIDLRAGENFVCTFTNKILATLTLVKNVTNNNGGTALATAWTLSASDGTTTVSGATGSVPVTSALVPVGTYTLSETGGPAGYGASAWNCTGGTLVGNQLKLETALNVTCTISNDDQPATLIVKKVALGGNSTFSFSSSTLGVFNLTTSGGAASTTFNNLNTGTYTVAETVPTGWILSSATCSDGSPITNISLSLGETVTCTFTNKKLGTINITKTRVGVVIPPPRFSFTGDLGSFSPKRLESHQSCLC